MKLYIGNRVINANILTLVLNRDRLKPSASRRGRLTLGIELSYAVMRRLCGSQSWSGNFSFAFVQRHTAGPLCF